ncbi:MAG: DUF2326 domain-containing protein [Planctomycetaceae bacterium]|nr:DUF2326 domain-containing protein [Planctomycetaceae bacterium]
MNVVLGEIRLPENRKLTTHNLGKTTLARLIDFCLCKKKQGNSFFLYKHEELFKEFEFFLEIETLNGDYVTIRRAVSTQSKLSFKRHEKRWQDFSIADSYEWDHENVAFDAGKQLLDGILDLDAVKPWDFRIPVGYALRTQKDFSDVFQLSKHMGKHSEWKPYVAHILGFDSKLIERGYQLYEECEELKHEIKTLRYELGGTDADLDQTRGLIEIKAKAIEVIEKSINDFDFAIQDSRVNEELVNEIDEKIATLNNLRYTLTRTQKRILDSLQAERIQFQPSVAKKLFEEAGLVFPEQLKKQFDDLIRFNREISEERIQYLRAELEQLNERLTGINKKLNHFNSRRQEELSFLGNSEAISKYQEMTKELIELRDDLGSLQRKSDALLGIRKKAEALRTLKRDREDQIELLQQNIDSCGADKSSRYVKIRTEITELCERLIGHKAMISTRINNEGNIDFEASYLDDSDHSTSEDEGKSFKQTLCAAYDLAVTHVLLDNKFIRFVFLDGLLEGLDVRLKRNMIEVLRELGDTGIQQILTVIDSDLPLEPDGTRFEFEADEIVLKLHDEGTEGRLFKMESW